MNKNFSAVAITTGDTDGIGFEVTAKALSRLGPQPSACFFIFRSHNEEKKSPSYFKQLDARFNRLTFKSARSALAFYYILKSSNALDSRFLFDLELKSNPADWFVEATEFCKQRQMDSLVTAPLSKTLIRSAGYQFVGHTGLFRQVFSNRPLHMGFIGQYFNVVLATDHVALKDVEKSLSKKALKDSFLACENLRKILGSKKPVGLLGLNPHAGEKAILGSFESKTLSALARKTSFLTPPLSPDAAFLKENWKKYSTYLALYHDQGLIPFKTIHGQDSGVHVTLGLPFVRTSVDHGTAKDIYGQNKARFNSMQEAIELNLKLIKKKHSL